MSESSTEEDQEISENTLNRIFYEQATHDRIIATLRSFKDQGFGYLDACTELSHVFLRLLERYSKQNVDMHVRTIKRARKKKKEDNGDDEAGRTNEDREHGARDVAEAQKISSERKFDFDRYAARFINQSTIDTFVAFTKHYRDLSTEQLKRAHRFFYRAAFKMNVSVYLFRVDILSLFNKMIKGPEGLDLSNPMFKELEELARQIFRRVIKKMQDRPSLAIELLFSKIPATVYYLEHGQERESLRKTPKAPAELEVKPGMDKSQQIGVAVSLLINQGKADALAWMKNVLKSASDERKSWEAEEAGRRELEQQNAHNNKGTTNQDVGSVGQSGEETAQEAPQAENASESNPEQRKKAPSILVTADNSERRTAMARDKHLRILLTVLDFQRLGDPSDEESNPDEVMWIIPSFLTSSVLTDCRDIISRHEFDPPVYEEGKSAESFVRRKVKTSGGEDGAGSAPGRGGRFRRSAAGSSDSEGLSEIDEELFTSNLRGEGSLGEERTAAPRRQKKKGPQRSRRAADELLDEKGLEERRKARKEMERERLMKVKSSLHVSLSDDESDEEKDRQFFNREAGLRRAVDQAGGLTDVVGAPKKKKGGAKGSGKAGSSAKPINLDDEGIPDADTSTPPPPALSRKRDSSVLDSTTASDTDTPSARTHNKRQRKAPRTTRRTAPTSTPSPQQSRAASPALPTSAVGSTYRRGPNAEISPPDSEAETDTENVDADGETPPTSQSLSQGANGRSGRRIEKVGGRDVAMRDAGNEGSEGSEDESDKENVDVGVLSSGIGDGVALERSTGQEGRARGGRRGRAG